MSDVTGMPPRCRTIITGYIYMYKHLDFGVLLTSQLKCNLAPNFLVTTLEKLIKYDIETLCYMRLTTISGKYQVVAYDQEIGKSTQGSLQLS